MDLGGLFGKIAGVLSLLAFFPYIIAIIRKQTKPNRASWWIWSVLGIMLGASYYSSGAHNTIWVPISYALGPFVIAILSIRYGEGAWNRFDRFCLMAAAISLGVWIIFKNPLIALIINIFIDFLGCLPTIRKAYKDPGSEDKLAWILFAVGNLFNLLAVEKYTFAILSYPIWMILGSWTIAILVIWPREKITE